MLITQLCASCQSVYDIPATVYKQMGHVDRVQCPACGHSNVKQEPLKKHGSQTVHHAKEYTVHGTPDITEIPRYGMGHSLNRSGGVRVAKKDASFVRPLESLRRQVVNCGRVFVLGTAPSLLQYDMDAIVDTGWPCIGVNSAFQICPSLDALVIADYGFICDNLDRMRDWQAKYKGRYLFWMRTTVRQGRELIWREDTIHGRCYDKETSEEVFHGPTQLQFSNVIYFEKVAKEIVNDLTIPIRLNFHDSVIFSAINLAYVLGAKEICLLGVEAETNSHADGDVVGGKFPKGKQIIEDLAEWSKELESRNVFLYTCREEGKLGQKLPYRQFQTLVSTDQPVFLECLRRRVQRSKKCFIMGAGVTLNDIPLHTLVGWPVIGTNTAFFRYPQTAALMFGDIGFIEKYATNLMDWQMEREEKPVLFWAESHLSDENRDKYYRVAPWEHAPSGPIYENVVSGTPKFSLKRSIVTAAINCAYWLGAKEIYLLGVELDSDAHFWDPDEKVAAEFSKPVGHFPGGQQIADFVEQQYKWLLERNIKLATCSHGLLDGRVPYVTLETATDPRLLNPNPAFGGQRKNVQA